MAYDNVKPDYFNESFKLASAQPERKSVPIKTAPSPPQPASQTGATVAFKSGIATGLVIDARGLGTKPALLPKVVDAYSF